MHTYATNEAFTVQNIHKPLFADLNSPVIEVAYDCIILNQNNCIPKYSACFIYAPTIVVKAASLSVEA